MPVARGAGLPAAGRRCRLTVAYDGTRYSGWQVQPQHATVQQTIEEALASITSQPCKLHGSGRTDQGVHALGQVAHVDLRTGLSDRALFKALNARLPTDIRVCGFRRVRPDFHARRDAVSKEYRYFVWNDEVMPPHRRLYALHIRRPLDLDRMRRAGAALVGTHDFVSFMANPSRDIESSVRTIQECRIRRRGREICFGFKGDGFLYKQVRGMTGLLLRIGAGQEPENLVRRLLEERLARTARVPSVPPNGLFLWRVSYRRRASDD